MNLNIRNYFVVALISMACLALISGCVQEKIQMEDNICKTIIPGSSEPMEPYIITKPGGYCLAGNRLCKGTGFVIETDGVVIDFMGYELVGSGKDSGENHGILTNSYKRLEVYNGTIRDFGDRGIVDKGKKQESGYKKIINMQIHNNGKCGICIGGPANLIQDCICADNGASGICSGYRSLIFNNLCHRNHSCGILPGRGCIIKQNTVTENGHSGIKAYSGTVITENSVYANNRTKDQDSAGIVAESGCLIKNNVLRDNQINDILMEIEDSVSIDNVTTHRKKG